MNRFIVYYLTKAVRYHENNCLNNMSIKTQNLIGIFDVLYTVKVLCHI